MLGERLARALADFNRRRRDSVKSQRLVRCVLETAQREARIVAEAARVDERLDLARRLFFWAAPFVLAREGRWVFEYWHRWRIAWDMEVDSSGRLWKAGGSHGYGWVQGRLITTPEELASLYPTAKLHDAVAATEGNVWVQALSKELTNLLLSRGRLV